MNLFVTILAYLLFLSTTVLGESGRYRAMWRDDPARTIVIGWEQIRGVSPKLFYSPDDSKSMAWQVHPPDRQVDVKGMQTFFVRLARLHPDTRYKFFIRDDQGDSPVMFIHTAPADSETPMTFLCGGDSRNNRGARQKINRLAAGMQPLAIFFSGDMTDWSTTSEWQEWLDDWQLTITSDKRLIPIVVARGNHEPSNDLLEDMFDVPHPDVYYALGFGADMLRLYTLNTMAPVSGKQTQWLKDDLEQEGMRYRWRMVQYHHPMRPHQQRKRPQHIQYNAWAPLFYEHQVQLVQESDAHVTKVTWPIRPESRGGSQEGFIRDNQKGTIYMGEGGWGAPLRKADNPKSWTRQMSSFHHFNWVHITKEKLTLRVIDTERSRQIKSLTTLSYGALPSGIHSWIIGKDGSLVLTNPSKVISQADFGGEDHFPVIQANHLSTLQIPYRIVEPSNVEIRFVNLRKQVVHKELHRKEAGFYIQSVALSLLPTGRYVLEVLANGDPIYQRMVER